MTGRTINVGGNQGRGDPPATRHPLDRAWRLEYECQGARYVWTGVARNQAAAETVARADLCDNPEFSPALARLVVCLEQ